MRDAVIPQERRRGKIQVVRVAREARAEVQGELGLQVPDLRAVVTDEKTRGAGRTMELV